jgi:hypothetical protein
MTKLTVIFAAIAAVSVSAGSALAQDAAAGEKVFL